jgi:hypothetical protein
MVMNDESIDLDKLVKETDKELLSKFSKLNFNNVFRNIKRLLKNQTKIRNELNKRSFKF